MVYATHPSPSDSVVHRASSSNEAEDTLPDYPWPSPSFPFLATGGTGALPVTTVSREAPIDHRNTGSPQPSPTGEGQVATTCIPPTGVGLLEGMQTLSSVSVFKILLFL